MNIIPLLILCAAIVTFFVEAVRAQPWRVQRIAFGLCLFALGVMLAFVVQTDWGHVVVH